MRNDMIEQIVMEYLDADTPEKRKREIRSELKKINYDLSQLDELEKLDKNLEVINIPSPSEKLDTEFFRILEAEKYNQQKNEFSFWENLYNWFVEKKVAQRTAFSLSLLIIGWFTGTQFTPYNNEAKLDSLNSQVKNMKEIMMISMLDQSSPMERMKAVSFVTEMESVDTKVVSALLHTLNHDENVNVRVVTIEALAKFANVPEVRAGLVMSISNQESPIVQLALADLMVRIQEKKSVNQFKVLLAKKDLRYSVREKIEDTIKLL